MSTSVALVTCSNPPVWEADDKPLIASLESRGLRVSTPSWTDVIDWDAFDATIIRTTWDYHLQIESFLRWAQRVPKLHNNISIIKWNTHKSYLLELHKLGVAIAPTVWIQLGEVTDISKIMVALNADRGFIKPVIGACASDTFRFNDDQHKEAQAFLDARRHLEMMVQPYLQRVETEGELSAIYIDGVFTHGVQKIPVQGDYRVQDDFGATDHPYTFDDTELETMKTVLSLVPHSEDLLYARIDFLRSDDGQLVLNELELVEPSLFFRHSTDAVEQFSEAITRISKGSLRR
jgi:glutathione synthase/RimK-type ligase-like ATP-grasp enzyme